MPHLYACCDPAATLARALGQPLPRAHEAPPELGAGEVALLGYLLAGRERARARGATLALELAHALRAAPSVVRLLIDSPGGDAAAVEPVLRALDERRRMRRRTVAVVEGEALSAAYWVAAACDEIELAHRQARVGGIGAFCVLVDSADADARLGLRVELVTSGGIKGAGADGRINPELREEVRRHVAAVAGLFRDDLRRYRGLSLRPEDDGRVFLGEEAVAARLADRISERAGSPRSAQEAAAAAHLWEQFRCRDYADFERLRPLTRAALVRAAERLRTSDCARAAALFDELAEAWQCSDEQAVARARALLAELERAEAAARARRGW